MNKDEAMQILDVVIMWLSDEFSEEHDDPIELLLGDVVELQQAIYEGLEE